MRMGSSVKIGFIMIMIVSYLSGCAAKPVVSTTDPVQEESTNNQVVEGPKQTTEKIKAFYSDDQLMSLHERDVEISYTTDEEKYKLTLKALEQSNVQDDVILWSGMELTSLQMQSGSLTIDVHLLDNGRLGAPGEELAIQAIGQALYQFNEVKEVDVLVDGQQAETLMGHVDLPHPLERQ